MNKKIHYALIAFLLLVDYASWAQCTNSGTALSATTTATNINCTGNDGSITVNASNGYINTSASNGNGYSYAITAGPLTRPTQSSNIFVSLPTGTYTVSIADCNGTTITKSATVGGTAPTALSYSPVVFKSICANNNAVKMAPSGGRAPYTVTVISAPAGSGTPVVKGDTVYNLAAGSLSAQITDACGTVLGVTTIISTNAPIAAGSALQSSISYGGCNGIVGDVYYSSNVPYIRYQLTGLPGTNTSLGGATLVVDSFWTELWYNGILMETKSPATYNQLNQINGGFVFTGYGPGVYRMRTFAKCAGLIKTDSIVYGNRPASPAGSNTNMPITAPTYPRLGCSDFDVNFASTGVTNGGTLALGLVVDVINPKFKVKILSGASHVGDSTWSTATYPYTAQLNNLSYSATPYSVEISDTCGNRDTMFFTRQAPTFTKTPTGSLACDGPVGHSDYTNAYSMLTGPSGLPKTYPLTITFLSGTAIDYTTFPFTVVDSAGALASLVPRLPVRYSGTLTVAYENGCGQKDTTVWTASCTPPSTANVLSYTKTLLCGNKGNLSFSQTLPGSTTGFVAWPVQWPAGATGLIYPNNAIGNTSSSNTFLNLNAGTYRVRAIQSSVALWNNPAGVSKTAPDDAFYISGAGYRTVAQTGYYGYPITGAGSATSFQTTYRSSVTWSGAIDTSKFRVWDTTMTIVIDSTTLKVTATEAYLCKDGTNGATIMARAVNNMSAPNFLYSWSTSSGSGPWSTPQPDSLLVLTGLSGSTPVWVKVTDACGSTAITNTTVGYLVSATVSLCNGTNTATITPSPYSSSFIYSLKNPSGSITNYNYGTPITLDLSNPANAGTYFLYYKLASAGTTGCVVDSIRVTAYSPCAVVLPVRLISFEANRVGTSVSLSWEANEENIRSYDVERSYDGSSFLTVGKVTAIGNGLQKYAHADEPATAKPVYYRLRVSGMDGEVSYSPVVRLSAYGGPDNTVHVSPNPANDHVIIDNISAGDVRLYDLTGRVWATGVMYGGNSRIIYTSSIPAGVYVLRVGLSTGDTASFRIVIAH